MKDLLEKVALMRETNLDENTSFAFRKQGTSCQVGYEWALDDIKIILLNLIDGDEVSAELIRKIVSGK